jgi:hypothetical protein
MIGDGVNGAPAMMAVFGYTSLWLAIAAYTGATRRSSSPQMRSAYFDSSRELQPRSSICFVSGH